MLASDDDVSQFDKKFTTSAPIDSPAEYTLSESANRVFQVRSYVSFVLINSQQRFILSSANKVWFISGFYICGT